MALYEFAADSISMIKPSSFQALGLKERGDLQRLLREQIAIISPDTLVIAEEFGEWEDSRRRIDLLGIDRDAKLVVIELKRTEDGGHMDLQAIRYAAMVSTMTFDRCAEILELHLRKLGREEDARQVMLDFLKWPEPYDERFGKDVRIVLASAEFSREITTAALWLNERDLDIRCVRLVPHQYNGGLILDVQQVIPLPEAADYHVKLREKEQKERLARETVNARDYTRYTVIVHGDVKERLPKRRAILEVVRGLIQSGVGIDEILDVLVTEHRWSQWVFRSVPGVLDSTSFVEAAIEQGKDLGRVFDPGRYFCSDGELIHANGKTFALTSQWGEGTAAALGSLIGRFPDRGVSFEEVPSL